MESPVISGHTVRSDPSPWDRPDDDGQRQAAYDRWRQFATGHQWEKAKAGDPPRRQTYNYARALIRKVASYVFPEPVTFNLEQGNDAAELLLNQSYKALGLAELDLSLEIERSTIGDAAVKVTWDPDRARPRVVSVDPGNITVDYSPEDPREPVRVRHFYQLPGWALRQYRFDILNDDAWVNVMEEWTAQTWKMHVSGISTARTERNPYGWIPYVFLPNNPHPRRFWGESDLVDLEEAARAFNRELSIVSSIMELSGAPIAVLEAVDGSEGITAKPGAKWELPEGSRAYLLDLLAGQGVRLHIDYLSELRTTLHDLSETPRTAFGDTGRALSGAALEVEIQPLVQRVKRKRASWERHYQERNRRILDLLAAAGQISPRRGEDARRAEGGSAGADRTTTTNWASVLPSDEDATVANQVALVQAQIRSRHKAAETLGETDPAAELGRIAAESQSLAPPAPPVAPPVPPQETPQ